MENKALNFAVASVVGRLLLAAIFIWSGYSKVTGYAAMVEYMQKFGVPGVLLPLVIFTELVGGVLIAIGWQTRLVAVALAGFSILAAVFFHSNFADRNQFVHFMKSIAIAGGFLTLFVSGPGTWSVDGIRRTGV